MSVLFLAALAHGELSWEKPFQEFQRHREDRDLTVDFAFRNTGQETVTITKLQSSCGCTTTTELAKKTYLPGESGNLVARFNFGTRCGLQAKSITVTTGDGKTKQLSFTCRILDDPVAMAPALLQWRVGEPAEAKQVEVTVSGKAPRSARAG